MTQTASSNSSSSSRGTSYASPPPSAPSVYPPPLTQPNVVGTPKPKPPAKPQNVFSNDGSFLERFQRLRREDEEKNKGKEMLDRKKHFADRFKYRGKRPSTSDTSRADTPVEHEQSPTKKAKVDNSEKVEAPLSRSSPSLSPGGEDKGSVETHLPIQTSTSKSSSH